MSLSVIVVASGRSERFGGELPKLLVSWRGRPLLSHALEAFDRCACVDEVVLVASEEVERGWTEAGQPGAKVRAVVRGGSSRQESVRRGTEALGPETDLVLVHDGARPFVSAALVERVAAAARRSGAALPLLPMVDTVKRCGPEGEVLGTVPREELARAQTPQGFRWELLRVAQEHAGEAGIEATDEASLIEAARQAGRLPAALRIEGVEGEESNVKVTRREDLPPEGNETAETRVGFGRDIHPLERGREFRLAGIDLLEGLGPADRFGPVGHSDGDALCHATCDALLGALGLGDIGQHFPDTDPRHAGRPSLEFVAEVVQLLAQRGWRPRNLSAVLGLERPRLAPLSGRIRAALAQALGLPPERIGLSAKRGEGLGPIGEGRAVSCEVVALVERWPARADAAS